MMNSRRRVAALCGTVVLSGCIVTWLAAFGSPGIEKISASVEESRAAVVAADAVSASSPATATSNAAVDVANVMTAGEPEAIASANAAPIAPETKPVVEAAVTDPALPVETQPVQAPAANTPDAAVEVAKATTTSPSEAAPTANPAPTAQETKPVVEAALTDPALPVETQPAQTPAESAPAESTPDAQPRAAKAPMDSVAILDECWDVNVCVDRYLWALYQRTPKEDSIKVPEQRQVTVKRKKKMVTVTRTFTKLVDEDFAWKDTKAADKVGMSMMDYVIGGVDRSFKLKLFHALLAAEQAGLSPGITSAFRDDYRQSIASGLKAASTRSYHGGSFHGGYGHGLAADIVSIDGATRDERWASSEKLWKWMDAHGNAFGVGRPYLAFDPPHLAPIDGQEYAHHRGGAKTQQAALESKAKSRHAAHHAAAKRSKTARSSRTI